MILTKVDGVIMGPISNLMGWIFNGLYDLFFGMGIHSIAFSIIVFTILIRLILFPLSVRSTRSSKVQAYLQPEFNKIQKKYKGKKDQNSMLKMQQETQALQKKYGIKMTSGCLTSLIQFPIFIALYNVMQNIPAYVTKIQGYYEPIARKIIETSNSSNWKYMTEFAKNQKLSRVTTTLGEMATYNDAAQYFSSSNGTKNLHAVIDILGKCNEHQLNLIADRYGNGSAVASAIHDNIQNIKSANDFLFGINLTETPGWRWSVLLIIPVASFVFQLLSMLVMPQNSTGDPQQDSSMKSMKTMMFIMPLFSFFITINVPAGLGLYWATSALISFLITVSTNAYYSHKDIGKIAEKMRLKAEKKNAEDAAKGKKSWADKMQEAATGQSQAEEEVQKQRGISKYSTMNLKSYQNAVTERVEEDQQAAETDQPENKKYKKGSLADRANAVRNYDRGE